MWYWIQCSSHLYFQIYHNYLSLLTNRFMSFPADRRDMIAEQSQLERKLDAGELPSEVETESDPESTEQPPTQQRKMPEVS